MAATRTRGKPPKLLIELLAILVLLTAAAVGIYFGFRSPPIHDELPLGGRNVNVSRSSAAQFEPSIALDPSRPKVLLVSSMDDLVDARVYVSTNGGASWTSRPAPPALRGACGLSHPAVAIGPDGLQVYASLASDTCQPPAPLLYVATRHGAAGAWRVRRVRPVRTAYDQRPSVAADGHGVVYVAWPRLLGELSSHQSLLLSRSTDGGRTWSPPHRIGTYTGVYGVDLAALGDGSLYLAVSDGLRRRIDLLRSADGGRTWSAPRRVGAIAERYVVGCGAGAAPIAAQPQRCVAIVPRIALSPRRVAVVYGDAGADGRQRVYVATADRTLRSATRARQVGGASTGKEDRFIPAVAYDRSSGDLWVCFYDTAGDSTRKHAWYTCTLSRDDGRTWSLPVHAASAKSDEAVTGADALGYGDVTGVVALGGVAHPVWTDDRDSLNSAEEIYTAAIPATALRRR